MQRCTSGVALIQTFIESDAPKSSSFLQLDAKVVFRKAFP